MRCLFICLFLSVLPTVFSQNVNYSPEYFGPNANPVAEFSGATIPEVTTFSVSGHYYFGFGDQTVNPEINLEVPLLPQKVSMKLWVALWEYYSVTQAIYDYRQMDGKLSGVTSGGDIYLQTRISILQEKKHTPAIVLNATISSASGSEFDERRYFDTPGYYFDFEVGKSFNIQNSSILDNVRLASDIGFLCWETTNSAQNDALMYGGKVILSNKLLDFENSLSGYNGWKKNGDKPLVFNSKLICKFPKLSAFVRFETGIRHFPYHHLQAGMTFPLAKLTPRY